jgi:error-prone DNA polymerase
MGFYSPSQLVADAQRHGVVVIPADVNQSDWDCTLRGKARTRDDRPELILGLRMLRGLQADAAQRIVAERARGGSYRDIADLKSRAGLTQGVITTLADADALGSLTRDRRAAIWQ